MFKNIETELVWAFMKTEGKRILNGQKELKCTLVQDATSLYCTVLFPQIFKEEKQGFDIKEEEAIFNNIIIFF